MNGRPITDKLLEVVAMRYPVVGASLACAPENEINTVPYQGPYDQPDDHTAEINACEGTSLALDTSPSAAPTQESRDYLTDKIDNMAGLASDAFPLSQWSDLIDCQIEATTGSIFRHNIIESFDAGLQNPDVLVLHQLGDQLGCDSFAIDHAITVIMDGDQRVPMDEDLADNFDFSTDPESYPDASVALRVETSQVAGCVRADGTTQEFSAKERPVHAWTEVKNLSTGESEVLSLISPSDKTLIIGNSFFYASEELGLSFIFEIIDSLALDSSRAVVVEQADDSLLYSAQLTGAQGISGTYGPNYPTSVAYTGMIYDDGKK